MAQLNDLLTNISNIKNDMKQAIINKGQNVTNFASYPNAILNIQSGGSGDEGDIKLFETVEELNNDPTVQEGDLACVYTEGNLTNFYEYKIGLINKDILAFHSLSDVIVTYDVSSGMSVSFNFDTPPLLEVNKQQLINITQKMINELNISDNSVIFYVDSNDTLKGIILYVDEVDHNNYLNSLFYNYENNSNEVYIGTAHTGTHVLKTYNIDLINNTYSEDITYSNWINRGNYNFTLLDLQSLTICVCPPNDNPISEDNSLTHIYYYFNDTTIVSQYYTYGYDKRILYNQYNSYQPLSLSMTADKEYVAVNKFLGKKGVEHGILQVNNNLTAEQVKIKTQVFNDLSYLELNSNVTNISNVFANRTDLIEIPNINLMNITNMENTFYNCVNLNNNAYNIITNILPNASQLTNQYISNIGLDINKFNTDQLNILNIKGYVDAIPSPSRSIQDRTNDFINLKSNDVTSIKVLNTLPNFLNSYPTNLQNAHYYIVSFNSPNNDVATLYVSDMSLSYIPIVQIEYYNRANSSLSSCRYLCQNLINISDSPAYYDCASVQDNFTTDGWYQVYILDPEMGEQGLRKVTDLYVSNLINSLESTSWTVNSIQVYQNRQNTSAVMANLFDVEIM